MGQSVARLTAAQEILLAASDLARNGKAEFTEWELTIAAWKRNSNRFGLRGFEERYPDHKRVMMEIMGQSKKDNPIRRKFLEKLRPNYYHLTDLGRAEATILDRGAANGTHTAKSPGPIYDAVQGYIESRPFRAWLDDPDEPRSWLGGSAFLGLTKNTANEVNDRFRSAETAARQAIEWCEAAGRDSITRGPMAGGRPIPISEIRKVFDFLELLRDRFARQITAIRAKA
jgi:hypothetical protein